MHNNAKYNAFSWAWLKVWPTLLVFYITCLKRIKGGDGREEGILGVDLGCGLRRTGVRVGMKYIKVLYTKPLHCSGPLLVALTALYYLLVALTALLSGYKKALLYRLATESVSSTIYCYSIHIICCRHNDF